MLYPRGFIVSYARNSQITNLYFFLFTERIWSVWNYRIERILSLAFVWTSPKAAISGTGQRKKPFNEWFQINYSSFLEDFHIEEKSDDFLNYYQYQKQIWLEANCLIFNKRRSHCFFCYEKLVRYLNISFSNLKLMMELFCQSSCRIRKVSLMVWDFQ